MKMKYIGGAWRTGIPAHDLTDEQVEKFGGVDFLLSTGLYVLEEPAEEQKQAEPEPEALPAEIIDEQKPARKRRAKEGK